MLEIEPIHDQTNYLACPVCSHEHEIINHPCGLRLLVCSLIPPKTIVYLDKMVANRETRKQIKADLFGEI